MILPEIHEPSAGFPAAGSTELPELSGYGPCERCGTPAAPIGKPVSSYDYEPYFLCGVNQDRACRERAAARRAAAPPPRARRASTRPRASKGRETLHGAAQKRVGTDG